MTRLLIVLLALQLCHTTTLANVGNLPHYNDDHSDFTPTQSAEQLSNEAEDTANEEDINSSAIDNSLESDDTLPIVQTVDDETEMQFPKPIQWVNIDHFRNSIILKFQTPTPRILNKLDPEEAKRLRSLQENAMRWGKRSYESYPLTRNAHFDKNSGVRMEYNGHQVVRDSRGDNFMRFGRSVGDSNTGDDNFMRFGRSDGGDDFMRFGRSGNQDFMRFGRSTGSDNFMRFGRSASQDFMRFGRSPGQDFMRFGRSPGQDFMRFGRSPEQDFMRFGRSPGQDFMRFGRSSGQDFMRFGRSPSQDFMRFGRSPSQDFMRFGRTPGQDFMRFGRSAGQDFMRFGRSAGQDFMRFGRAPSAQDFMRFGRSPGGKDFMRFGRSQDFMRFGRAQDFMRFGRAPSGQDFMRFGRSSSQDQDNTNLIRYSRPDNFMRFGRTPAQQTDKSENKTATHQQMGKSELKQAVKLIHEADKNADSGNPVDKAIKALFDKHEQQDNSLLQHLDNDDDDQAVDSTQHEDPSSDPSSEFEYFLKLTN